MLIDNISRLNELASNIMILENMHGGAGLKNGTGMNLTSQQVMQLNILKQELQKKIQLGKQYVNSSA